MFTMAKIIEVDSSKNQVRVSLDQYNDEEDPNFIPVIMPPIGEGQEGMSAPLAIGDNVVIGFFDNKRQKPFVLGKLYGSNDFIQNKKIVYEEHEIEFTESNITITLKNGTKLEVKDGVFTFTSPTPFLDISIGGMGLLDFLLSHTHIGNLGLPTPLHADSITQISNAKTASTEIKFGS